MNRKIIQIAVTQETADLYSNIYAVCEDGSLWRKVMSSDQGSWTEIAGIPIPTMDMGRPAPLPPSSNGL